MPKPASSARSGHLFDTDPLGEGDLQHGDGFLDGEAVDDGKRRGAAGQDVVTSADEALDPHEPDEQLELAAGGNHPEGLKVVPDLPGSAALFQRVLRRTIGGHLDG